MLPSSSYPSFRSEETEEHKRPLITDNDDYISVDIYRSEKRKFRRVTIFQWVLIAALVLVILLTSDVVSRNKNYWIPNELYSPARPLVRYQNIVFDAGFGNLTKYMGSPTEENNRHWEDLYNTPAIIKIPMDQAAKLPVKTVPLPEDPGYYVVGIDVFHQLHCLNQLRLKVWSTDNQTHHHGSHHDGLQDMEHLDHCIDSIRQSLMCSSDISTIIWAWDAEDQIARPHANVTHTCRDFEAIRLWALERQAPVWNQSIYVPDPLKGEVLLSRRQRRGKNQ